MRLQQQVANDSPSQLVSRTFRFAFDSPLFLSANISILTDLIRSVEAKVARRNSLASVPNLNESTEAGSPFALARRSLSAQLQLQVGLVLGLLFEAIDDSILFF